ncbi:MAG: hypothetical protein HY744_20190 [Deltaproteobacteria bacterium]|nr:hypothetical protein [Deltaproteobacteria bacterium]
MTDFARYSPAAWQQDGLVVQPEQDPPARPRGRGEIVGAVAVVAVVAVVSFALMPGGVAIAGLLRGVPGGCSASVRDDSIPSQPSPVSREVFGRLVEWWARDCLWFSSTTKRTAHPAFRRIVSMGRAAVPFLLEVLETPGDWDIALAEITGADPVPPSATGRRAETIRAWREWARQRDPVDG